MVQTKQPDYRRDVTVEGSRTKYTRLSAEECTELGARRIARVGVDDAEAPYLRVRLRPAGSFVLAVCEGEGRVWLDGHWQEARAGTALLAPPRALNIFEALPGHRWNFAWVRFDEPPAARPLVTSQSPLKIKFDGTGLRRVIRGLLAEWNGARDAAMIHHWVELLYATARRIAGPVSRDERLWKLWEKVGAGLAEPWDLNKLAAAFHSSKEHLRQKCLLELGRSPMEQLRSMRIRLAQERLEQTDDKIEVIADGVGYQDPLVFSRAFKRSVGCSPSEYRRRA